MDYWDRQGGKTQTACCMARNTDTPQGKGGADGI